MRVEEVTTFEGFRSLEPVWNGLLGRSDTDVPFLTFEWLTAWWKSFGAGRELFILLVKDGGDIVAIAPLMKVKKTWRRVPVKAVSFMANEHSYRSGIITASQDAKAAELILNRVLESSCDLACLDLVVKGSAAHAAIQRVLSRGKIPHVELGSDVSPYISLSGTWEDYLKRRSRNYRSKINLVTNQLKRSGQYGIARYTVSGVPDALDKLLSISKMTWKYREGTAIASRPESADFYRLLAAVAASKGWLNINILEVRNTPVAFIYNLVYKGKAFFMKTGFDERYRSLSSGDFLNHQAIRECFERNLVEYDLLGDVEPYKLKLASACREHRKFIVFGTTLTGRMLHCLESRVISGVKSLLGLFGRERSQR